MRVLLVDEDMERAEGLKTALRAAGCTLSAHVHTPENLLAHVQEIAPDLPAEHVVDESLLGDTIAAGVLTDEVRQRADLVLSLSAMTFPHQLVRVLFAEQLYRAYSILNRTGYHH